VVARLRAPGGCPWDREQTHESLKPYIADEAFEVIAAIEDGDRAGLVEELGDVMLLVLMEAQLGAESGEFELSDVFRGITTKLIRRHPHVFGDVQVAGTGDVLRNWDQIKRDEKTVGGPPPSTLPRLPASMPALAAAAEQQR